MTTWIDLVYAHSYFFLFCFFLQMQSTKRNLSKTLLYLSYIVKLSVFCVFYTSSRIVRAHSVHSGIFKFPKNVEKSTVKLRVNPYFGECNLKEWNIRRYFLCQPNIYVNRYLIYFLSPTSLIPRFVFFFPVNLRCGIFLPRSFWYSFNFFFNNLFNINIRSF